jgi:hypothetical protein
MNQIQTGSTITNGYGAMRVTGRSEEPFEPGWLGLYISLGSGELTGTQVIVPDRDLPIWRHVPFEWTRVAGTGLAERYVWSGDHRRLVRQVRQAQHVTT